MCHKLMCDGSPRMSQSGGRPFVRAKSRLQNSRKLSYDAWLTVVQENVTSFKACRPNNTKRAGGKAKSRRRKPEAPRCRTTTCLSRNAFVSLAFQARAKALASSIFAPSSLKQWDGQKAQISSFWHFKTLWLLSLAVKPSTAELASQLIARKLWKRHTPKPRKETLTHCSRRSSAVDGS